MFKFQKSLIESDNGYGKSLQITKFEVFANDNQLSFGDFFLNLKTDQKFRCQFRDEIVSLHPKYPYVFFECPCVNSETLNRPFEFVLIRTEHFKNANVEKYAFMNHFRKPENETNGLEAIYFDNLGRDGVMVVPKGTNGEEEEYYSNLMGLMRKGDPKEIDDFWKLAGEQALKIVNSKPMKNMWMSTSGLGVDWTHLRLCEKPKYYNYKNYKTAIPIDENLRSRIVEVKDASTFDSLIHDESRSRVIFDVYSDWCDPCKRIRPDFETLAHENPDIIFAIINNDENANLIDKWGIKTLPYFKMFAGGEAVDDLTGFDPSGLRKKVENLKNFFKLPYQNIHDQQTGDFNMRDVFSSCEKSEKVENREPIRLLPRESDESCRVVGLTESNKEEDDLKLINHQEKTKQQQDHGLTMEDSDSNDQVIENSKSENESDMNLKQLEKEDGDESRTTEAEASKQHDQQEQDQTYV